MKLERKLFKRQSRFADEELFCSAIFTDGGRQTARRQTQHYTHFKPFSLRAPNFNITQSTAAQDVIAYFMK